MADSLANLALNLGLGCSIFESLPPSVHSVLLIVLASSFVWGYWPIGPHSTYSNPAAINHVSDLIRSL